LFLFLFLFSSSLRSHLGGAGSYLPEETLNLKEAGIEDGQRLIVERVGDDATAFQGISLRFLYAQGTKALSDIFILPNVLRTSSAAQW
jgi:hypothetical protein